MAAALLLLAACSREPPEPGPGVIRLVDLLPVAEINSPLIGLAPTAGWSEDLPASRVFDQDFEDLSTDHEGWIGARCLAAVHPRGRRALRCRAARNRIFVIPVEPSSLYRFRWSAWGSAAKCADLDLLESSQEYLPDELREFRKRAFRGQYLEAVHSLSTPPAKSWQEGSHVFFTTPASRSLIIDYPRGNPGCAGWYDDLHLDRLQPRREQELAVVKGELPAEGSDFELGIAKHGRLLPQRHVEARPPFDQNYSVRDALLAPAPTDLVFDLTPPPGARLRLSYGLSKWSRVGDKVTFRVAVEEVGKAVTEELLAKTVRLGKGASQWYWHEARLDLGAWAGRAIRLRLETRAPAASRGYGLWGNPVIDVPRKESDPPNIILIAVDTLRADRLGTYGNLDNPTPTIDRLADDGIRFAQASSQVNWTTPSFASVFTGEMPSRHGLTELNSALASGYQTLAERFQDAGWATHAVMYKPALQDVGLDQGFDEWFNVPRIVLRADHNLEQALAWLEDNHDRRFFLFLHFNDPHQPFTQPEEFVASRRELDEFGIQLPLVVHHRSAAGVLGEPKERRPCGRCAKGGVLVPRFKDLARGLYDGAIAYLDDRLGRFLQALEDRGLYDDAVIVFFSDHGEAFWEHGEVFGHGGAWQYDNVLRVPLIIKPPRDRRLARGRVVESQVRLFDLMPTLLELGGLDGQESVGEARSLMPYLSLRNPSEEPRIAVAEMGAGSSFSVRTESWKYIRGPLPEDPGAVLDHLFDLRADPGETTDVASNHPDVVRSLRNQGLATVIRNRAGRWLIVQGVGATGRYTVHVRAPGSGQIGQLLFGLERQRNPGPGLLRFAGEGAAEPLLILRFPPVSEPVSLKVELLAEGDGDKPEVLASAVSPTDMPALAPGHLAQLFSRAGPRIVFFEVAAAAPAERQESGDAQRLEALRALGYIN